MNELNDIPSKDAVLYSLVSLRYEDTAQTGFYDCCASKVYILHPIGYYWSLLGTGNINFAGSQVYRSNDGPYEVQGGYPNKRYISLSVSISTQSENSVLLGWQQSHFAQYMGSSQIERNSTHQTNFHLRFTAET